MTTSKSMRKAARKASVKRKLGPSAKPKRKQPRGMKNWLSKVEEQPRTRVKASVQAHTNNRTKQLSRKAV